MNTDPVQQNAEAVWCLIFAIKDRHHPLNTTLPTSRKENFLEVVRENFMLLKAFGSPNSLVRSVLTYTNPRVYREPLGLTNAIRFTF